MAAIYCRVSTVGQEEDGSSLATQEERCRKYAAEHGYEVDESQLYREVYTGTELWDRPQLTRLREGIRHQAMAVVVAYAIDRLSRDPAHLGVIISEAEHYGIAVAFVTEPLDNTPEGQLIRFVRGYAARVEAEKIRERSLRGKRVRADDVERWVWEQVLRILRDPEIIAAELRRRREAGPDPTLLANRDAAQRRLTTLEKQQAKLLRSFREAEEDLVPWELVKRELAHIEQEKVQAQAELTDLGQRLDAQEAVIVQLDTLTAYCQRVVRKLSTFGFEEQRLALDALGVTVVATGREWALDGNIPVGDAPGTMSPTSWGWDRPA